MSAQARYLLDKVIVRYTLDGMLSLSSGRDLTDQQAAAIRLFQLQQPSRLSCLLRLLAQTSWAGCKPYPVSLL